MQPLIAWLRDVAAPASSGVLLDWGCGNKPYASFFAPFVRQHLGADVVQNSSRTVEFIVAPGHPLPLESQSVDTVLSTQVLEHVAEPDAYLAEAARVLRPGGLCVLTCPGHYMLHEEPHDYYRYTRYGLEYLLGKQGLEIERLDTAGGSWRQIGQSILNHKTFGVPRRIPLLSGASVLAWTIATNAACALFDAMHTNRKDPANYLVLARRATG
jgi:SAM-dependent methyltransferase